MKLKFKKQAYQTSAVEAAADCLRASPITSDQVKYDVVDGYGKLMELVK